VISDNSMIIQFQYSMPIRGRSSALCTIFLRLCYDGPAMADLGLFTKCLWAITAIVQVSLLCVLIVRRNANIYPAFSAYIFMTLAQSGLLFLAIRRSGFSSPIAWRIGWATQCLVVGARAFAVAELCRRVLGRFRGVWLLARWILLGCGATVLLYALLAANHQLRLLLTTAELGLELATAAVIVTLLLFARYYEVIVARPLRLLAISLCLYSCISALNDAILERWLSQYIPFGNNFGMAAFLGCLLLWTWAFRHPVPRTPASPMLGDGGIYMSVIPEVNMRLRSLNDQLLEFWSRESSRT
jgi:hypothetical protein